MWAREELPNPISSHLRGASGSQSSKQVSIPGVLVAFIAIRAPIVWTQTWWPDCPLWFLITVWPPC